MWIAEPSVIVLLTANLMRYRTSDNLIYTPLINSLACITGRIFSYSGSKVKNGGPGWVLGIQGGYSCFTMNTGNLGWIYWLKTVFWGLRVNTEYWGSRLNILGFQVNMPELLGEYSILRLQGYYSEDSGWMQYSGVQGEYTRIQRLIYWSSTVNILGLQDKHTWDPGWILGFRVNILGMQGEFWGRGWTYWWSRMNTV